MGFLDIKMLLPYCGLLGLRISAINMDLALDQIKQWVDHRHHQYVCVTNVHVLIEAQSNPSLRCALNHAGMVTPDGMPLVWFLRLKGYSHTSRVYGPDLLLAACQRSLETGWSHYFYGGAPGVAEKLVGNLLTRYPGIRVAGTYSPPYRSLTPEEDRDAVERINQSGADIVWVGLGAPKQELWMAEHLGKVQAPVLIGVGAAFDFHAGVKRQAPLWMQRSGFEWLFRLIDEPKRLWKRYLINNPLFLWLVFLQLTGLKRFPIEES